MNTKEKVRIEDLIVHEPIYSPNREKSKCSICQEFANIHCINCSSDTNVWLCIEHWKQHNVYTHT